MYKKSICNGKEKKLCTDYIFVVFTEFEAFKLSKETNWNFFIIKVLHGVIVKLFS